MKIKLTNTITTILGIISILCAIIYPFTKYYTDSKVIIILSVIGLWLIYLKNKRLHEIVRIFVEKITLNK